MRKVLKKIILTVIIIILLIILIIMSYLTYVDIKATRGKDYLIEKYNFKRTDLLTIESTEYVFEDIVNCETLWFKKCSDDENLAYQHVFKTKDNKEIIVTEYVDGNFSDNFEN